ncbi:hypothetical protein BaRGS_00010510 [Batillaria attramentaria]|uniref:Uncharacterized protein n=1 Tax=Batillaria attramentaria TaxID=370345 RepID=A0ABD0LFX3_9CAEN
MDSHPGSSVGHGRQIDSRSGHDLQNKTPIFVTRLNVDRRQTTIPYAGCSGDGSRYRDSHPGRSVGHGRPMDSGCLGHGLQDKKNETPISVIQLNVDRKKRPIPFVGCSRHGLKDRDSHPGCSAGHGRQTDSHFGCSVHGLQDKTVVFDTR